MPNFGYENHLIPSACSFQPHFDNSATTEAQICKRPQKNKRKVSVVLFEPLSQKKCAGEDSNLSRLTELIRFCLKQRDLIFSSRIQNRLKKSHQRQDCRHY